MFAQVATALFSLFSVASAASIPNTGSTPPGMPSPPSFGSIPPGMPSPPSVGSAPIVGNSIDLPNIINGVAPIRRTDNTCNTGPVQCCQNVENADAPTASQLLALLGVQVQDVNVPVGVHCNPITGIGAGSASCEAEPVCCEDNNYHGLVALGCLPINVGL